MAAVISPTVAAVLPLGGVALGALLAGIGRLILDGRAERRGARAAARLVATELAELYSRLTLALAAANSTGEKHISRPDLDSPEWMDQRALLARVLSDDDWITLEQAYSLIREIGRWPNEIPVDYASTAASHADTAAAMLCKQWRIPEIGRFGSLL